MKNLISICVLGLISIFVMGLVSFLGNAQTNPHHEQVGSTTNPLDYMINNGSAYPYNSSTINSSLSGADVSSILYDSRPSYHTTTKLNMRERRSSSSEIILSIPKGVEVKVIDSFFGDWWEVYYNGKTGHVSSKYLAFDENNSQESDASSTYSNFGFSSNLYNSKPSYFTSTILNMLENRSSSSAIISKMPKGAKVKIVDSFSKDWWEVYYNGKTGYVLSKHLTYDESNNHISDTLSAYTNFGFSSNLYNSMPSYYTSTTVSLRENRSSSSAIITKIPKGKEIKVVDSFYGDWIEVFYNGKTGYVLNRFLTKNKIQYSEGTTHHNSPVPNPHVKGQYSLIEKTSLREMPESQATVILRLYKGDTVTVIDSSDEWWWEVTHNGNRGWIKNRLLIEN